MEKAMINQAQQSAANSWTTRRDEKRRRIDSVRTWMQGPILSPEKIVDALELLVKSGDRVCPGRRQSKAGGFPFPLAGES
jgi:Malonate decarboxylase, alpha subunit, transporter